MKKSLAVIILLLLLAGSIVLKTKGQERLSITAFPATQDKAVELGGLTHLQVQFKNEEDSFITGAVKVADYVVTDKQGSTALVEEGGQKPKYAASSWISLSTNTITIPPNDIVTVDLFVQVPEDVPNCGNYAIIYFQPAMPSVDEVKSNLNSGSGITARIGALLNFRVAGRECRENIVISRFAVPAFQEFGPLKVDLELLNNSDIDLRPKGIINVINFFGRYVDAQRIKDQRIFPETVKAYETQVGSKWMIGRYKLALSGSYGEGGKNLTAVTYVWVFPWRVGLIILLTLIILALLIRSMVGRSKKERLNLEKELGEEKNELEKLKAQLKKRDI